MSLIELNEKLNSLGLPNFSSDKIKKISELFFITLKSLNNFGEILNMPPIMNEEEIKKFERNKEEATIQDFLKFLENEKNAKFIKMFYSIMDYFE